MSFREATIDDIPAMQVIRDSVKENVLSDPALVTYDDYVEYLMTRGKGWVAEKEGNIAGFAIADIKERSIWALFVHPDYEHKGIGKELHRLMLNWYFLQTSHTVWLTTAPNTRAEAFYRKAGWKDVGRKANGEIRFEMSYSNFLLS